MLAHIVLITLGLRRRPTSPPCPATFWDLSVDYPGMLLAVAGTACLVMVVVTSIRAARRRLRYESWHLLHLYAYLGVGLALPHQLWTGQEFLASTAAHRLLVDAVGGRRGRGAGLAGRRCRSWRTLRHRLRVTSVVAARRTALRLGLPDRPQTWTGCRSRAGQFLIWRFLSGPGWTRAHPYSLSAAPDGRSLRITVKELGDGSAPGPVAAPRHPGARRGAVRSAHRPRPHPAEGRAHRRRRRHHPAAGAGRGAAVRAGRRGAAAPLRRPSRCSPASSTSSPGERGLQVRLAARSAPRPPTPGSALPTVAPTTCALLRRWVPDIAERDVYVCGPTAWTDLVAPPCRGRSPRRRSSTSRRFGW